MTVYGLKDDDGFSPMVPADPKFDTILLNEFVLSPVAEFPAATLEPLSEEEQQEELRPIGDVFLLYGIALPVFSLRAMKALTDLLAPSGTFHKVQTTVGPYFAFKITRIIDALDYSRSDIEYEYSFKQKKKVPREIRTYQFHLEKLNGASLFIGSSGFTVGEKVG